MRKPSSIRRPVFTAEKRKVFLDLVKAGNTLTHACEAIGVSHDVVEKYRLNNPEYNAEVLQARESRIRIVEDALYQTALTGHVTAQIFFLVNRTKFRPRNERWENLQNIKHDIQSEIKAPEPDLSKLSDEELAELGKLLEKSDEKGV